MDRGDARYSAESPGPFQNRIPYFCTSCIISIINTVFLSFQKPNNKRNCNDVSLGNPPDAKIPRVDDTTTPTTPTATTSSSQQVSTPQTSTNRNEEEEEGEND